MKERGEKPLARKIYLELLGRENLELIDAARAEVLARKAFHLAQAFKQASGRGAPSLPATAPPPATASTPETPTASPAASAESGRRQAAGGEAVSSLRDTARRRLWREAAVNPPAPRHSSLAELKAVEQAPNRRAVQPSDPQPLE